MAYFVNRTDGNIAAVVEDGTINTQTSLKLIGIGYPNYAETVAEDMVALLENFSNPNPPASPVTGQTWFNNAINQLEVFDGDIFRPINNMKISNSEPSLPKEGDFWYNSDLQQMFYRTATEWQLISPSYSQYQGRTELAAEWLVDTGNLSHVALTFYNNGERVIIFSTDTKYRINNIDGFSWINPGINIPNYLRTQNGIFWAGNGNPYYAGGLVIGGTDTQIQYNYLGNLAGASITTNGTDLTSNNGTFQALNLRANQVTSSQNGYVFPDNTVQTTAAFNNSNAVNGTGGATQMAYFSDTTHVTGATAITTDGTNLFSTGLLSAKNLSLLNNGGGSITFPDGSVQTTAAFNNASAVNGSGATGELAYFSDSTHLTGTSSISTDGTNLTLASGVMRSSNIILTSGQGGTITFQDGSIQRSAATATAASPQVQSDWNVTDNTQPSYIKNKPTISNNTTTIVSSIQISYPTAITQNSTFSWGVSNGVANETWYATSNLPSPYDRIPTVGTFSLNGSGSTSYVNGNWGGNTGDVEVVFHFSQSGTVVKRLSITAPTGATYSPPTAYGSIGTYTIVAGAATSGQVYTNNTIAGLPPGSWRCMGSSGSSQTLTIPSQSIYVPLGGDNATNYTIGGQSLLVDTTMSMFLRIS